MLFATRSDNYFSSASNPHSKSSLYTYIQECIAIHYKMYRNASEQHCPRDNIFTQRDKARTMIKCIAVLQFKMRIYSRREGRMSKGVYPKITYIKRRVNFLWTQIGSIGSIFCGIRSPMNPSPFASLWLLCGSTLLYEIYIAGAWREGQLSCGVRIYVI